MSTLYVVDRIDQRGHTHFGFCLFERPEAEQLRDNLIASGDQAWIQEATPELQDILDDYIDFLQNNEQ